MAKYTEKTPFAQAHYHIGLGHRYKGEKKQLPTAATFEDKRDLKLAKDLYKKGWQDGKPETGKKKSK